MADIGMIPTHHEKMEWARCAQAMYARDQNDLGHKLSTTAAIPTGARIATARFDEVSSIYRAWLVFDEPK